MSEKHSGRMRRVAALLAAMVLLLPSWPQAHEIPVDVTVQLIVVPRGPTLGVAVRVPMEALRDYAFPTRGPGYLNIAEADPLVREAAMLWVGDELRLQENGALLEGVELVGARVSLPSDRSFASYDEAVSHILGEPLPESTELPWRQALVDLLFEIPIASDRSDFAIDPSMAHLGLRTLTVLRFRTPDEIERIFQFTGNPGLVRLDPSWLHAAWRFVVLGFFHILDGIDHLLFLLCLVVPFRRVRPLIALVTSFTVAHSITLIASASGLAPRALWFPPLIETLIAASIVYMAFENILGADVRRRWVVAFAFGLVHGFGFSFVLSESLQFAGGHLLTSLLAFNVGVELGQLFVLLLTVPVLEWVLRRVDETVATILLSAVLAHGAWHWMTERGGAFLAYDFRLPAFDAFLLAALMRWAMLLLILVGVVWVLRGAYDRLLGERPPSDPIRATSDAT